MFLSGSTVVAQTCLERAREVQPQLSLSARQQYEARLAKARADFETEASADNLIWLGRRTAYLGQYKEAIEIFARGIEKFPGDARLYRHRGHRFITLRCFNEAIADLEHAAKLVKGKEDEVEPDGLPNARNIPTSTLQSNIFYHLGLAHYLKGDFEAALKAYREAERVSKNPDMQVATVHWLYMTLRRLGRVNEANAALAQVAEKPDIIENADYFKLIQLYRGRSSARELQAEIGNGAETLSSASLGYGIGNWFLYNDQRGEASRIFRQITGGNQWASFGYIAAEAELTPGPEVVVVQKRWHIDVRNPKLDKNPIQDMNQREEAERRRIETERTNDKLREQGMPTPTTQVPGRAASDTKRDNLSVVYVYEVKLRNSGSKEITSFVWDYVFFEPGTETELGRRRFTSKVKIKPGKTKDVTVRAATPPTGTIDAKRAGKKPQDQYAEQVVIQRVEYADGSVWQSTSN